MEDCLRIFLQLGMTMQQAKVFLALSKLEHATVKAIAVTSRTDRAEVYRVMPELEKLGLVKRVISKPTAFKAVPLPEGVAMLLQFNAEKQKEIRKQVRKFLRNLNYSREKPVQDDAQYYLATGAKLVERDYLRDLSQTKTSKDCILDWRGFLYVVYKHFEYVKEVLERGVKIRYITYVPEGAEMPRIIQKLISTGSFEVRHTLLAPSAGVDIFDDKFVHIIIMPNSDPEKLKVLRSTNTGIVGLARDYFELKWQSAIAPRWCGRKNKKGNIEFSFLLKRVMHAERRDYAT